MYYMEATPEELRREYRAERAALYTATELARHVSSPGGRRKMARVIGAKDRRFELICNVARKRGIDLLDGPVAD
jgi:hypothetical protein